MYSYVTYCGIKSSAHLQLRGPSIYYMGTQTVRELHHRSLNVNLALGGREDTKQTFIAGRISAIPEAMSATFRV